MNIDNTEQNNKYRLYGERDKTINHIVSECSKQSQKKYKTKHDWVGKLIHLELCKRSPNLGQKTKHYNQQKKKTCKIVDFVVSVDLGIKLKESEKKDKYLDLPRELKKLWNMKVTIVPIVIGVFGTNDY